MGLFSNNYNKPGPGIDKNAPKKKGLNLFYDTLFRKFWDIIKLNMLYTVTILPCFALVMLLAGAVANDIVALFEPSLAQIFGAEAADINNVDFARVIMYADIAIRLFTAVAFTVFVGAGPMTAGLMYILRAFVNEQPVFPVSDYFRAVKANLKQSLSVWVCDIIIFTAAYYAIRFYGNLGAPMMYMKYALYLLLFFFTILHFFIYHLMISYKMPFIQLYRNAALFAIPSFPFCLLVFAACAFLLFIFPAVAFTAASELIVNIFGAATVVFWVFLAFGVCGLIIEFNACRQVMRYIKEDSGVEEKKNIHSR